MARGARRKKARGVGRRVAAVANKGPVYTEEGTGREFRALRNMGMGSCGPISQYQSYLKQQNTPWNEIQATTGQLDDTQMAEVQKIRTMAVQLFKSKSYYDGRFHDGVESKPYEDVVYDSNHIIETLAMWERVTLNGWVDGLAMNLMAEGLGLEGFALVEAGDDMILYSAQLERTTPVKGKSSMILIKNGHYEALYQCGGPPAARGMDAGCGAVGGGTVDPRSPAPAVPSSTDPVGETHEVSLTNFCCSDGVSVGIQYVHFVLPSPPTCVFLSC